MFFFLSLPSRWEPGLRSLLCCEEISVCCRPALHCGGRALREPSVDVLPSCLAGLVFRCSVFAGGGSVISLDGKKARMAHARSLSLARGSRRAFPCLVARGGRDRATPFPALHGRPVGCCCLRGRRPFCIRLVECAATRLETASALE